jgi:glycine/D-amino acid oxidase-like deaminating enzyme
MWYIGIIGGGFSGSTAAINLSRLSLGSSPSDNVTNVTIPRGKIHIAALYFVHGLQ